MRWRVVRTLPDFINEHNMNDVRQTKPESHEMCAVAESNPDPFNSNFEENDEQESTGWMKLCPWRLKCSWFRNRQYVRNNIRSRVHWDNRMQYILTLIGYAVGLGNLWRFSYLVAKNGGATFIVPYFVMLFLVGIPLFYMESTLGQSLQLGPIRAWYKICPNLWGIGLAGVVVTTIIRIYYNIIIGWVILYFFHSFHYPLPWSLCDGYHVSNNLADDIEFLNSSINQSNYPELLSCVNDSTRYYWYNNVLQATTNLNDGGSFSWELLLTFFASWVAVYLCIFKGIKSSGKVVYFTATFPYIVMITVFFRAVSLNGAGSGIKFLFIPNGDNFQDIFKPQVWLEAATQIFFSSGLSLGTIVALSSYSKPTNNNLVDSLIVCLTNSFTSIFASIIVFSIVGFKAHELGTHPKLVSQGPGLAFIVITEALTLMPVPQLWSVLFFIMLFLLGLDSHFGGLEVLITVLYDVKRIRKHKKQIVIGIICLSLFLLNIPFAFGNGFYLFQVFDQFTATIPLLTLGCIEIITISYIFGVYRFFDLVKYPVHSKLRVFWWFMWTFVSPVAMVIILLSSLIHELIQPLKYTVFKFTEHEDILSETTQLIRTEDQISFPDWAEFFGSVWIIGTISCVPVVLLYRLVRFRSARHQIIEFRDLTMKRMNWIRQNIKRCVFVNGNSNIEIADTVHLHLVNQEE